MGEGQLPVLLTVLQDDRNLSSTELARITYWTLKQVGSIQSHDEAERYRAAALTLRRRAGVDTGSIEWLTWFKSPPGTLYGCLTARLMEWDERSAKVALPDAPPLT